MIQIWNRRDFTTHWDGRGISRVVHPSQAISSSDYASRALLIIVMLVTSHECSVPMPPSSRQNLWWLPPTFSLSIHRVLILPWNNTEINRGSPPCLQIASLSTASLILLIWPVRSLASFVVMLTAMTGRLTPQALPSAALLLTYTNGTFLSSQRSGRWRSMARGEVSAASTISSAMPRFKVFVAVRISDRLF